MSKNNREELVPRIVKGREILIEVSKSGAKYHSKWYCHSLGREGCSSRSFDSVEEAINGAEANAFGGITSEIE